nr:restriction endonuclease [uncultured Bacteroides sp.]
MKGLTQTLTNQPYYFAINAYPAAILGWRKGMVLDISQFEDWFNNKHDNKNVFAFCLFIKKLQKLPVETKSDSYNEPLILLKYLTAIRSKPFLLLAGISGTGKSRIVRELAFKSCPKYLQDKDETTPGNYCMIEVKPNWHDSTELLGYYSNLSKSYQFKKFVKFLIKAKMFPDVPFFVCLDEMNLAPVEQYFAEILSVLETRKHPKNEAGEVDMSIIKTGVIIEAEYFKALGKMGGFDPNFTDRDIYMKLHDIDTESDIAEEIGSRTDLTTEGLTLPDNVIIIGTVNMDDTTHQFSRKVIDRAMTIEMNGGRLKNMFGGSNDLVYLKEEEQRKWQTAFKQKYVNADEVLKAHADKADEIVNLLPEKLEAINAALKDTPFEVSYRVLNELTIMVGVMLDNAPEEELETIVNNALDRILLMKILPRIEGDSDMFNLKDPQQVGDAICRNRLEWLSELAPAIVIHDDEGKKHQQTAKEKIKEMIERLESQEFTRFWP